MYFYYYRMLRNNNNIFVFNVQTDRRQNAYMYSMNVLSQIIAGVECNCASHARCLLSYTSNL